MTPDICIWAFLRYDKLFHLDFAPWHYSIVALSEDWAGAAICNVWGTDVGLSYIAIFAYYENLDVQQ